MAAVSVVLPWSTWPMVPILQWGLSLWKTFLSAVGAAAKCLFMEVEKSFESIALDSWERMKKKKVNGNYSTHKNYLMKYYLKKHEI